LQTTDLRELLTLRPVAEYHEDMGDVLWWSLPITEAPWVGTTNTLGYTIEAETIMRRRGHPEVTHVIREEVGGWSDRFTHWSPIPMVVTPNS
jgi:hypothetical protein